MTKPPKTMEEIKIADALKFLRKRIVGFQASNNVFRVVDEEISKHDPDYQIPDGPMKRRRQIADRENLIKTLKAKLAQNDVDLKLAQEEITAIKAKLLKFEGMTFSENEALKIAVEALEYCANNVDPANDMATAQKFLAMRGICRINLAEIRKLRGD